MICVDHKSSIFGSRTYTSSSNWMLQDTKTGFSDFCFTIELHVHDVQALPAYRPSHPCLDSLHEKIYLKACKQQEIWDHYH